MKTPAKKWIVAMLGLAPLAAVLAAPPQFLASREIMLEYRAASDAPVDEVRVWVSTDAGRTWQAAQVTLDGKHTLRYSAPGDGRYDFYVVLQNAAGASNLPPSPGARPAATVIVDTLPPLLQIDGAEIAPADECGHRVTLRAALVEENLSPAGVRLFYRDDARHWTDAGVASVVDEHIAGSVPACTRPAIDLRVVVTDLAGNMVSAEVSNVAVPPLPEPPPEPPAATQPAPPPEPPASEFPAPLSAEAQRLRQRAVDFMAEGRFALAAARLEDALALAPDDVDTLVDLGLALYRAGRYEEAGGCLRAALDRRADHVGALDALALVAATQKQYSLAREYMSQLQRLQPEAGQVWLRSGDIEHRLGNTAQALAAWRQVLTARDADQTLRDNARRRLEYFASRSVSETQPATGDTWHDQPQSRPSWLPSGTTTTAKPPP